MLFASKEPADPMLALERRQANTGTVDRSQERRLAQLDVRLISCDAIVVVTRRLAPYMIARKSAPSIPCTTANPHPPRTTYSVGEQPRKPVRISFGNGERRKYKGTASLGRNYRTAVIVII